MEYALLKVFFNLLLLFGGSGFFHEFVGCRLCFGNPGILHVLDVLNGFLIGLFIEFHLPLNLLVIGILQLFFMLGLECCKPLVSLVVEFPHKQ